MRGVGPAGKMLRVDKVSGRRAARTRGGMKRVGGRVVTKNDWHPVSAHVLHTCWNTIRTYGKFTRAPQAFEDAKMV